MNMEGREKGKLAAALRSCPSGLIGAHTPISVEVGLAASWSGRQPGWSTCPPGWAATKIPKAGQPAGQLGWSPEWWDLQSDFVSSLCPLIGARSPQVGLFHIPGSKPKSLSAEKGQCNCLSLDFTKCAILTTCCSPLNLEFLQNIQNFLLFKKEPSTQAFVQNNRCRHFQSWFLHIYQLHNVWKAIITFPVPHTPLTAHSAVVPLSWFLWLFLITPCTWEFILHHSFALGHQNHFLLPMCVWLSPIRESYF